MTEISAKNGAKRDRTADLRLARAALSQLSYSPLIRHQFFQTTRMRFFWESLKTESAQPKAVEIELYAP